MRSRMRAQGGCCCHRARIAPPPTTPASAAGLLRHPPNHPPRVAAVLHEGKEIHFNVPHIPGGCIWGGWGLGRVCGGVGGVASGADSLCSRRPSTQILLLARWTRGTSQSSRSGGGGRTSGHSPQPAQRSARGQAGKATTAQCLLRGAGMYPNQFRPSRRSQPLTMWTRGTTPPLGGRRRAAWAAGPLRQPPRRRGPAQARPKPGRGPRRWGRPACRQRA